MTPPSTETPQKWTLLPIDRAAAGATAGRPKRSCFVRSFGALYFTQGVSEPTEGLVVQPTRWLLKSWGETNEQITSFAAWITLPWLLKPLYGLIADFLPLGRNRRKNYLMLTTAVACLGFLALYFYPPGAARRTLAVLGAVSADRRRGLYRRGGRRPDDRASASRVASPATCSRSNGPRFGPPRFSTANWAGNSPTRPAVRGAFLLSAPPRWRRLGDRRCLRDDPPPPHDVDESADLAGDARRTGRGDSPACPVAADRLSGAVELYAAVDDGRLFVLDARRWASTKCFTATRSSGWRPAR